MTLSEVWTAIEDALTDSYIIDVQFNEHLIGLEALPALLKYFGASWEKINVAFESGLLSNEELLESKLGIIEDYRLYRSAVRIEKILLDTPTLGGSA